jgi:hypothetical protein
MVFQSHASKAVRTALAVAALVVLAGACASKASPRSAPPSPNGTVVQVTQSDASKVTTLHVGDTLRIQLGPPLGNGFLNWELRAYPKDVLSLLGKSAQRDQFDLLATSEGRGTVSLVGMVRCEGGPMAAEGVQCPVLGPAGSAGGAHPTATTASGGGGGMPARLVLFQVTVTA